MTNKTCFVLFPTQLYEKLENIPTKCDILLVEDPVFYFDAKYKPFKVNKIKIAFLHACLMVYKKQHKKIHYVSWHDIQEHKYNFLQPYQHMVMYDPIDHDLMEKYNALCNQYNINLNVLDSPDLLFPKDVMKKEYFDVKNDSIRHASFYKYMKEKLDILQGISNMDKMNRSPPPKEPPHKYNFTPSKTYSKIYSEAIKFAENNFASHYGSTQNVTIYPISHKEAKVAFDNFLEKRFKLFGTYEDAIMKEDPFMYHSIISPLLNIGLLTPKYILTRTLEFYKHNRSSIPLASLEGFLRQIVGWRCFMQALYIFKCEQLLLSNLPKNNNTFKDMAMWYNGETGIYPLDQEIKKAVSYGFAHHIVRLMMFMNFFILCELHPYEIYKWFMEVVSMDAYSWVMVSNIYAMGYFHPKIMTKPYLSTSNYIVKMSNYKKDGVWDVIWDGLYYAFVSNKPKEYTFFYKHSVKKQATTNDIIRTFKEGNFIKRT